MPLWSAEGLVTIANPHATVDGRSREPRRLDSSRRPAVPGHCASLAAVVSQRLLPRVGGGLVAAFELLVANDAVRNLIRDGRTHQLRNVIRSGKAEGMQTLEDSLNEL